MSRICCTDPGLLRVDLAPDSTIAERGAILRERLQHGGVVAIPTESSYGLAVDPRNPDAVRAVYHLKGRLESKALPVVVADFSQLADLGIDVTSPQVRQLEKVWPAPLSAVLPIEHPLAAAAGERTLAVRIPDHDLLRQWLRFLGPLTATSANRSGEAPILDPEQLVAEWGDSTDWVEQIAILDGGLLQGGPPSTLIAWQNATLQILRHGRFPTECLPV